MNAFETFRNRCVRLIYFWFVSTFKPAWLGVEECPVCMKYRSHETQTGNYVDSMLEEKIKKTRKRVYGTYIRRRLTDTTRLGWFDWNVHVNSASTTLVCCMFVSPQTVHFKEGANQMTGVDLFRCCCCYCGWFVCLFFAEESVHAFLFFFSLNFVTYRFCFFPNERNQHNKQIAI